MIKQAKFIASIASIALGFANFSVMAMAEIHPFQALCLGLGGAGTNPGSCLPEDRGGATQSANFAALVEEFKKVQSSVGADVATLESEALKHVDRVRGFLIDDKGPLRVAGMLAGINERLIQRGPTSEEDAAQLMAGRVTFSKEGQRVYSEFFGYPPVNSNLIFYTAAARVAEYYMNRGEVDAFLGVHLSLLESEFEEFKKRSKGIDEKKLGVDSVAIQKSIQEFRNQAKEISTQGLKNFKQLEESRKVSKQFSDPTVLLKCLALILKQKGYSLDDGTKDYGAPVLFALLRGQAALSAEDLARISTKMPSAISSCGVHLKGRALAECIIKNLTKNLTKNSKDPAIKESLDFFEKNKIVIQGFNADYIKTVDSILGEPKMKPFVAKSTLLAIVLDSSGDQDGNQVSGSYESSDRAIYVRGGPLEREHMIHEFGHSVDDSLIGGMVLNNTNAAIENWKKISWKKLGSNFVSLLRVRLPDRLDVSEIGPRGELLKEKIATQAGFVSFYAMTNPAEDFAESFLRFIQGDLKGPKADFIQALVK